MVLLHTLCACVLSCVRIFSIPWNITLQAPLSMAFHRQYWNGLPSPPPWDLPNPGINLHLLHCGWILYHWTTEEALTTHPRLF